MNDEIKEILNFKENADYKKLSCDEIKVLRDYITNLQEQLHQASLDIQELIEKDIECPSWCDKLTNLQQKIKHYEETTTFGDYDKEVNLLVDYKSRIEKTVEYIESQNRFKEGCDIYLITNWEYVLNILKGEDND